MIRELYEQAWDTGRWADWCLYLAGVTPIGGAVIVGWVLPDLRAAALAVFLTAVATAFFYRASLRFSWKYWQQRQAFDDR